MQLPRLVDDSNSLSPALNRVLLAIDLSPAAANLLCYAAQFCRRFGVGLYVAHVLHPDVYPFQLPETWPEMADAELERCQQADSLIRDTLRSIPYELIHRKGEVWPTIRKIICDKSIDLLIAGTHGRSGMSKAIIGSVAEQMLRGADCPVLTIGPNVPVSHDSALRFNRVLYATDFSVESLSAVPCAISLCKRSGALLTLLHCHQHGGENDVMLEALRQVIPLGSGLNSQPQYLVTPAHHCHAILELAHQEGTDLIVLGLRRVTWYSKLATHFTDSTTYHIISQAECPVLTVRN